MRTLCLLLTHVSFLHLLTQYMRRKVVCRILSLAWLRDEHGILNFLVREFDLYKYNLVLAGRSDMRVHKRTSINWNVFLRSYYTNEILQM